MFASVMFALDGSIDADAARLVALGAWDEERQHAIAIFGLDAVGIDLDRHREGAIERSGRPLTPMQAYLLGIREGLLAGDTDGVVLGLDLQVGFVDIPASSMMATRFSPCWKTLMGGNAPVPVVAPRNQSLSRRDSSAL
jgi:hypothetical protein